MKLCSKRKINVRVVIVRIGTMYTEKTTHVAIKPRPRKTAENTEIIFQIVSDSRPLLLNNEKPIKNSRRQIEDCFTDTGSSMAFEE